MNKKNLIILANHLTTISSVQFDMTEFNDITRNDPVHPRYLNNAYYCPSVGCILGHAPTIKGFGFTEDDISEMTGYICWELYTKRVFDIDDTTIWTWLFGAVWAKTDNTVRGAVKRIEYTIKNGLPHSYDDEMHGYYPLSYLDEKPLFKLDEEVMFGDILGTIMCYHHNGKEYTYTVKSIGPYPRYYEHIPKENIKKYEA